MERQSIGLLYPGAMGAQVGVVAVAAGHRVCWVPAGRGAATRARAEAAGLEPLEDLAALARTCGVILSVCPPAAALDVARAVAGTAFTGLFVDANAISPGRAASVAGAFGAGVEVADGGLIGPPPRRAGTTRLVVSGPAFAASRVAEMFAGTVLDVHVLPGPVGQASALKLAFAAYNKISFALAAQSSALAAAHGVLPELLEIAGEALPGTPLARPETLVTAGPRAWRWGPEMAEIADAYASAGLAPEIAFAAERLFARWNVHKDDADVTLGRLLDDLPE